MKRCSSLKWLMPGNLVTILNALLRVGRHVPARACAISCLSRVGLAFSFCFATSLLKPFVAWLTTKSKDDIYNSVTGLPENSFFNLS